MIAHKNNLYPPFNKTEKLRLSSGRKSLGNYEETCINHQLKPARFKAVSDEADLFYCEKCAILLASQGFKVMRTSNSSLRCSKMNPLLDHSK
jgi:predicted SprT family Zn-dependent metalloprotease